MALIKHAFNQGRDCVDNISNRVKRWGSPDPSDFVDVWSWGPSAESALRYEPSRTSSLHNLEQDEEIGGTVAKYPAILVMTSPVNFPCTESSISCNSRRKNFSFLGKVGAAVRFQSAYGRESGRNQERAGRASSRRDWQKANTAHTVILWVGKGGIPRNWESKEEYRRSCYRLLEQTTT